MGCRGRRIGTESSIVFVFLSLQREKRENREDTKFLKSTYLPQFGKVVWRGRWRRWNGEYALRGFAFLDNLDFCKSKCHCELR